MKLLHGRDEDVVRWLEDKMQDRIIPPWKGIGIVDDAGHLRGAHVLTPVTVACAEWSLYSEGALTHGVMRQFFRVVFGDMGLARLQIRTARNNKAIRRGAPKMGFKFEGVAPAYWGPGRDALMFYMTRDMCRWIRDKSAHAPHEQRWPIAAKRAPVGHEPAGVLWSTEPRMERIVVRA